MVYIYRPFATSNAIYSPDLYINDEFKLSIINGNVTHFTLPPGHFKFELGPGENYSGITLLSLDLSAGSTHFIRVDTSLKIISTVTYEPYKRSYNMTKVENQLAIKEIAKCCMDTKIKSKTDEETKTVKKQAEDGFSVDKMQKPFSH